MLSRRVSHFRTQMHRGPYPLTLPTRAASRLSVHASTLVTSSAAGVTAAPAVHAARVASAEGAQVRWPQKWEEVAAFPSIALHNMLTALPSWYACSSSGRELRSSSGRASRTPSLLSDLLGVLRRVGYQNRLAYERSASPRATASLDGGSEDEKLISLFRLLQRQRRNLREGPAIEKPQQAGRLSSRKDSHNNINHNGGRENGSGGGAGGGSGGSDQNRPDGEPDDDGKPEDWIIPRTCLFVLLMFAITAILYQLARPRGVHTGWASLNRHAGEIGEVVLYENYLQVYLHDAKVYLGLVNDQDTQRRMDELADHYRTARQKMQQEEEAQQQQQSSGKTPAKEDETTDPRSASVSFTAADMPAELEVSMKGRPLAETALIGVGVVAWVVPFIFFPVFVMFLSQYIGKSMSYAVEATKGKTKAKEMIFRVETASQTRFRDVAGMMEPKKEITEIVDFLRHPERYTKLGAKIPTGALLLGPPGTGKTLLAKAVAGESGVGFIPAVGSDFVELYVGMGALRVRQLFEEARKQRCIVYIDEIDAIGLKRQGAGHGEKQEQEQTLNELLTQLDGFGTGRRGDVMVLASSNVAQEALDPALIRPGRFDRIVHVDTPVLSERIDIFKVHLCKLKLISDSEGSGTSTTTPEGPISTEEGVTVRASPAPPASTETRLVLSRVDAEIKAYEEERSKGTAEDADGAASPAGAWRSSAHDFDFRALLQQKSERERAIIEAYAERMSNLCPGFVGADIANVCNEGAILAAREGADHVDISHLERSIDRVLAGIEHRSRALSDFEKTVVAHHEAGHAVAGWFLNRADPLMKVSIVPRGGSALGYAQYLPNENYTRTAKEIRDAISVSLGGRAAEQIFFNHLSTGASDDLRKVGRMAYQYVSSFEPGSVYPPPGSNSTRLVKPFGVDRSNAFDRRAKVLVDEVYADTIALLTEHRDEMKKLADHLLKHELLTYSDVVQYLGERTSRQKDKKKGV